MAVIPTVSPRPTLNVPASPAPQLANPQAAVMDEFGGALQELAAGWQAAGAAGAEAAFQDFKFNELRLYDATATSLTPDKAAGFTDGYLKGFEERKSKWLADNTSGMTPAQRRRYENELGDMRLRMFGTASELEQKHQFSFVTGQLDTAIEQSIKPRAADVAKLPDDARKTTALAEVEADAFALIDASALTAPQKQAKKEQVRKLIQKGFAEALPPAEKSRLDPSKPDETVVDRILGVEGRRKNPNSSAVGPGQFIDDTWVDLVTRYRPDIASGLSRQQILDLRTGPMARQLGQEMVRAYAQENIAYLDYHHITPTAGNIYLAHFLGPAGAVAILSADPNASAAEINPKAAKANPTVFYYPGDDGRPDISQPRSAGDLARWAGSLMAGTYHTDYGRHLDALSHDEKVALAVDGSRELTEQRTKTAQRAKAEYDARLNAAKNGVLDGTFGIADLADAYADGEGWLTDAGDRQSVMEMIRKRDADVLALAQAQAFIQSGDEINPFDDDHRKAVNLWYEKLAGGGENLYETDGSGATILRATVERTRMIPDKAKSALLAGIWGPEAARRDQAMMIMDGLSRQNPAAYRRAFSDEDRKRVDIYQKLAPMISDEALIEALDPAVNPQQAQLRERRQEEGRKLAQDIDTRDILSAFDETFLWGGEPGAPEGLALTALREDFENAFAEAYAYPYLPNAAAAKELALKWLGNKWGKTDIGGALGSNDPALAGLDVGGPVLMPYPPERYYPSADGSHDWMDDQLADEVDKQFPGAQHYWIMVDPFGQTEADVAAGILPSYRVGVVDANGEYRFLGAPTIEGGPDERTVTYSAKPALVRFDYNRARAEGRMRFEDQRARDAVARDMIRKLIPTPAQPMNDPAVIERGTSVLGTEAGAAIGGQP